MEEMVKRFFFSDGSTYSLNEKMQLSFGSLQEACQFLVEVILYWKDKKSLFCENIFSQYDEKGMRVDLPEEVWFFSYKTPSTHNSCVKAGKILDKIFGERQKFNELPFVKYNGDRQYSFDFDGLKYYAQFGKEKEKIYKVVVDYSKTLAEMIKDGNYRWIDIDITDEHFQLQGTGQHEVNLKLVHLRNATKKEVLKYLNGLDLEPAKIEHLLAFGAAHTKIQNEFIVISALGSVWDNDISFPYIPCLNFGGRELDLMWDDGGGWKDIYYLALRK